MDDEKALEQPVSDEMPTTAPARIVVADLCEAFSKFRSVGGPRPTKRPRRGFVFVN